MDTLVAAIGAFIDMVLAWLRWGDRFNQPTDDDNMKVYCSTCREWVRLKRVVFLNVEEGPDGRDLLTFKCRACGQESTSAAARNPS